MITWEEILEVLQSVRSQPFANDLDQFRAMYEALTFIVESPTTDEEVLRWREREGTYINLVDHVSRRLTTQGISLVAALTADFWEFFHPASVERVFWSGNVAAEPTSR